MINKRTRQIKLHSKFRASQTGWQKGKNVPWLNVSGVWLEQAGFETGSHVEITVENNLLTIKKCTTQKDVHQLLLP